VTNKIQGGEKASRKCPSCHSKNVWKDGKRKTKDGSIQRYVCRDCWRRFSRSSILSMDSNNSGKRQVCEFLTEGSKNLAREGPLESGLAGATNEIEADIKGKVLEFAWQLKRDGLTKDTIDNYVRIFQRLMKNGANLLKPESVKQVIVDQKGWSINTKAMAVRVYGGFLSWLGITWRKPKYKQQKTERWLPREEEIDALISASGKKLATLLTLLKETGMRIGEAKRLEWTDIDFKGKTVTVTKPEKNGKSRTLDISEELIAMLNRLPKDSRKVFKSSRSVVFSNFYMQRKRAAEKLQNPRLSKITFHTLRHWRGTREYEKTLDPIHVRDFLGHSCLKNTEIYIHRLKSGRQEYHVKATKDEKEAIEFAGQGFEYWHTVNGLHIFRKPKY